MNHHEICKWGVALPPFGEVHSTSRVSEPASGLRTVEVKGQRPGATVGRREVRGRSAAPQRDLAGFGEKK